MSDAEADLWTERYGGWTPDQVARVALLCGWLLARHSHASDDRRVSDAEADLWTERYGGWTPDQVARMALLCGWLLARHSHADLDGMPADRAGCWGCRVGSELMGELLTGQPRRTGP